MKINKINNIWQGVDIANLNKQDTCCQRHPVSSPSRKKPAQLGILCRLHFARNQITR
jgi:hypothetical protein